MILCQDLQLISNFCSLTFRWIAIPFFQVEFDRYVERHNTTRRRANKHKVLPHGIPQQMFEFPDSVDALDFKVSTVCPILIKG